jgi:hypothetical protein|tara:strand:+ start:1176 stop:1661 length:486 start_codon:yes stop_codon:yes gene_type:complete
VKIKIAFYKGRGNFINGIVRWWTKSEYSHAELVLPDDRTWLGISPFLKSKVDSRQKLIVDNLEWDFISLEVTSEQRDIILEFFEETKGCGYDWIGMLLSQFLPCRIKHKKKWYCSEWIAYALRIACVLDWRDIKIYERKDLSPVVLYELANNSKKPSISIK